ncbi:undecaprenyl-diphosphatase [Arboricoccus pini]|uniref:Undecaprenyl-diphosphatase n=1 Tax=Arboricoccus pini TaxID=1963835 RepID=A0A212QQE1_9PROT|nr:phosphatase PAP2 family protein [Arboricoccus pini]SNB61718.1 undecaprenyl-diphosphatase [Arboricoccus pini]
MHVVFPVSRRGSGLLLAFAIVVACLGSFAELAEQVATGGTRGFDEMILLGLRHADDPSAPLGPKWLQIAALDLTSLGSIAVLCLLTTLVFFYLLLIRRRALALLVAVALGGGLLAMPLLKRGFDRPRPNLVPHMVDVYTQSFPSGHAMLSAIVYLTLGALVARAQKELGTAIFAIGAAILLTLLIGASRVYLAVHWPSDVLAGWAIGAAWALLCWLVASCLDSRNRLPAPRVSDLPTR